MRALQAEKWSKIIMVAMLSGFLLLTGGCSGSDASKQSGRKNESVKSVEAETADTTEAPEQEPENGQIDTNALPEKIELSLGETRDIVAEIREVSPSLQLSCEDDSVLKILEDGSVFGIGAGTTQVTIQAGEQSLQTELKVWKRGMVYPVFTMMEKEVLDLQFSSGKKAADYDWTTSNPKVAKVTKAGKVKAKGIGTAVVTGTAKDQSEVYRCEVTVTKRIEKVIYLTFDDGPNRYSTPKILNILKKNDVKATFFELKPAKKDFDLTERVLAEGHTLAMHGYQHKYDRIYKSEEAYHENLDKLRDLFFDKFGVWCTLTRFPGGSSNMVSSYNPGIMTKLTKELDDWGYHYFDWNVSSGDAGGAKNSDQVYRNFKRELSKEHASVVLMHDFDKNDKTINALDRIIKYGKKHGYTFLPLTAGTDEIHHKVSN